MVAGVSAAVAGVVCGQAGARLGAVAVRKATWNQNKRRGKKLIEKPNDGKPVFVR